MNKKAQFGIITFVGLVIVLLALAPVLLKVVRVGTSEFSVAINETSPTASANVDGIVTTYINLWDFVILLFFGLNVVLLLMSAFFIDTHPAFVIMYIMACFFIMAFAPNMMDSIQQIYDDPSMSSADEILAGEPTTGHDNGLLLPATEFLIDNFGAVILGIMVLSGIIMYAKFKYFGT